MTPDQVTQKRIWGDKGYRLFLSHLSEAKREVATVAAELKPFGVSSFVAHEQIKPTVRWISEIEAALMSTDALAALLTKGFHGSDWTDQEIGYALGRGVPVVSVALECQPLGFVGSFQSLNCKWADAPSAILSILVNQPGFIKHYAEALKVCESFDMGNDLGAPLAHLDHLDPADADHLVDAYNSNGQLRGSFVFSGAKPDEFGPGPLNILGKFQPKTYTARDKTRIIKFV